MDEMRMVRDFYPEPAPPTARQVAQARALLDGRPRRALPRLWLGLGGAATVGVAAVVAVALTAGSAPAGGSGPAAPGPVTLDARTAVLAAADKAAQQPAGQYWYTDDVSGQAYIARPATGAYAITGSRSETFSWWGAKPGMGDADYDRTLAAEPVTARDEAAWRAAGSPPSFRVWAGDHYDTFAATATTWQPGHPDPKGGGDFPGAAGLADPQALPTDPGKLAAMFLSPREMAKAGVGRPASPGAKVAITANLLDSPVPPKVRSGLIRALADQPGVTAIGGVTDPLGRHGVALASADETTTVTGQWGTPAADQGTYRSRQVLIFDQATGAVLASEAVLTTPGGEYSNEQSGFVIYYQATRSQGWTNAKPAAPSAQLPPTQG